MKHLYLVCALCLHLPRLLIAQDAPGTITTVAGGGTSGLPVSALQASISFCSNVYADARGNIYIHTASGVGILRVGLDGIVRLFVGGNEYRGDINFGDGKPAATSASIGAAVVTVGEGGWLPTYSGVAVDANGNAYLTDGIHHHIRRVDTQGYIWTIAGTGNLVTGIGVGFSGDGGLATDARLNKPMDVALDARGNLYIADFGNDRIRRVTPDGFISTFAGTGGNISGPSGDGGQASQAILNTPVSVAVDVKGNVYIAEYYAYRIRRVTPDQIITTFAGTGTAGYSGDGGPATQARLSSPTGVAVDGAGNVYIADQGNNRIRRVDKEGIITTFAGTGKTGYSGDGGPATQAVLDTPSDVAVDPKGYVYIADFQNRRIRRVSPLKPLEVPSISLSVPSLLFDVTNVGATSELTFTISNTGKAPLEVSRIGVEGTGEFRVSPTSATVDTGASLTVKVTFSPASFGSKSASVTIEHNAAGSPATITLTGSGPEKSRDFNNDGKVNFDDFFLFAAAFRQTPVGDNAKFDLDGNGKIDFDDFFLFAARFGR